MRSGGCADSGPQGLGFELNSNVTPQSNRHSGTNSLPCWWVMVGLCADRAGGGTVSPGKTEWRKITTQYVGFPEHNAVQEDPETLPSSRSSSVTQLADSTWGYPKFTWHKLGPPPHHHSHPVNYHDLCCRPGRPRVEQTVALPRTGARSPTQHPRSIYFHYHTILPIRSPILCGAVYKPPPISRQKRSTGPMLLLQPCHSSMSRPVTCLKMRLLPENFRRRNDSS